MNSSILAADIGGTNCRLGLFKLNKNKLSLDKQAWIETGSIAHTEALLAAFERELETGHAGVDSVVVSIAGPVEDCTAGKLSNGNLEMDFGEFRSKGLDFFLINDFMAQAYAVLSPEGEKARLIAGPKKPARDDTRAVIGAGTGLGQATLVRLAPAGENQSGQWLAVPSENGHSAFPFVNGMENDFHTFLRMKQKIPYSTGDNTINGSGLAYLHEFLTGEKLIPAQVGAQYLSKDTETLRWYSRMYARACRNWILSTRCDGGLWIAGGIAAQNPLTVTSEAFVNELYNSPLWEDYLRSVPIYLMEDTNSGLWGAARFGQQQLELTPPPMKVESAEAK